MRKKNVIIVEDDALLMIVLRKLASVLDFTVVDTTRSGKEAVESIKKHQPDLILMDIFLSDDVNGIQAMQKIRQHSNIPVIFITAQNNNTIRDEASLTFNSFFMLKPISAEDLKSAVNSIEFNN